MKFVKVNKYTIEVRNLKEKKELLWKEQEFVTLQYTLKFIKVNQISVVDIQSDICQVTVVSNGFLILINSL